MVAEFRRSRALLATAVRPSPWSAGLAVIAAVGAAAVLSGCSGAEMEADHRPPQASRPESAPPMTLARTPSAPPSQPGAAMAPAPVKPWTSQPDWQGLGWDVSHAGAPLQTQELGAMLFSDDFNTCSIGKELFHPVGHFNWYARKEKNAGQHGTAFVTFDYPDSPDGSPFVCPGDGYMHMYAHYDNNDKTWHTGDIDTQDTSHEGFSTKYGYLEFRTRFNSSATPLRPWIALWAWSREDRNSAQNYNARQFMELDLVETFLRSDSDGNKNASTIHYWPSNGPAPGQGLTQHVFKSTPIQTYPTFDDQWHTYGLAMTPQYFIVYRDRLELARLPRSSEDLRQPMAPIISISSFFGPQGADTSKAYDVMEVDYVHVYGLAGVAPR